MVEIVFLRDRSPCTIAPLSAARMLRAEHAPDGALAQFGLAVGGSHAAATG